MSDFRAVGNSEWPVNRTFIRQIFAPILSSPTLSNIIKKMICFLFSTKPSSKLTLTCHYPLKQASVKLCSNFNNFYSRKLIVKCCCKSWQFGSNLRQLVSVCQYDPSFPIDTSYWHLPHCKIRCHVDGWVQKRRNCNALAMELRLSCTNPSMWYQNLYFLFID